MSASNLGASTNAAAGNAPKSITEQQKMIKELVPPPVKTLMSTPIKGGSFAGKPSSSKDFNNSSLPLFMLSHIHNQTSSSSNNRIYPENSPERKTHDSLLRNSSPYKHVMKSVSHQKTGAVTFNDEANMIERMESRKLLDFETQRELTLSLK